VIDGAITASTLSIDATSWLPPGWAVASQVASQQMVGARAEGLHLNTEGEGFQPSVTKALPRLTGPRLLPPLWALHPLHPLPERIV
jgi:hypothetical protein